MLPDALAKSSDHLDKPKDHSGAAPWPSRGGNTHKGLGIQDEIILPHVCCAPQKAPGSLKSASCKESGSPRNGSPHLHCSLFPSLLSQNCVLCRSFDLQPLYCKWDFERTMVCSGASARCWKKQLFKIIFSVIFVVFWK